MILLIVLGSFCVYCVQNGARPIDGLGLGDGVAGPVARAAAQSTPGTSRGESIDARPVVHAVDQTIEHEIGGGVHQLVDRARS
jgi:hypothetical protein